MSRQAVRIIDKNQREFLDELAVRKSEDLDGVLLTTAAITDKVKREGDSAVIEFTAKFDKVELSPSDFRVTADEVEKAAATVDPDLADALDCAYERITDYHRKQLINSWFTTGEDGEILGQKITPVASAAIYAPGGKAAYPSSVLMGVAAARTAGVERIVLLTPLTARESSIRQYCLRPGWQEWKKSTGSAEHRRLLQRLTEPKQYLLWM